MRLLLITLLGASLFVRFLLSEMVRFCVDQGLTSRAFRIIASFRNSSVYSLLKR